MEWWAHVFLSDLCGREVLDTIDQQEYYFLSDLCGREDFNRQPRQ